MELGKQLNFQPESPETKSCSCCKKCLPLSVFHKKAKRLDSRCKGCVSKAKRAKNKAKKKVRIQKQTKDKVTFKSSLTGDLGKEFIDAFASIFVTSVKELIEDGTI